MRASKQPISIAAGVHLAHEAGRSPSWRSRRNNPLYLMLLPALVSILLFNILPLYGLVIAFQRYNPLLGVFGSPWVGLANFERVFSDLTVWRVIRNTLLIAIGKIVANQAIGLMLAILLNEVLNQFFKRFVQSITYCLYFLSWVVFGGIMLEILSLDGIANNLLAGLGIPRIQFFAEPQFFPATLILSDVWKNMGFSAVVYLAALTNVDPHLHEAAAVDGADRVQRIRHITLPTIVPTMVLLAALSLGSVLDAGMEQVLVLYNPLVYQTGDIVDTYIYRVAFQGASYSIGAAVGLAKSLVGMVLILLSLYLARRLANYRIL